MMWLDVELCLRERDGAEVRVAKGSIASPLFEGASQAVGLPSGQLRDWRFAPHVDCTSLHVREYSDHYEAHLDRAHPSCDMVRHVVLDVVPELVQRARRRLRKGSATSR